MSGKRRGNVEKPRKYRKGLPADYRGATPERVARALHRYRPERPVGHGKETPASRARVQASI